MCPFLSIASGSLTDLRCLFVLSCLYVAASWHSRWFPVCVTVINDHPFFFAGQIPFFSMIGSFRSSNLYYLWSRETLFDPLVFSLDNEIALVSAIRLFPSPSAHQWVICNTTRF
jgi:hypothetical protein